MHTQLKHLYKIFGITIILSLICILPHAKALDVTTHRAINEYVSQNNLNAFFLDEYLRTQLGIQEGIKTYFKKDELNQQVFRWVGDGGVDEDTPPACIPYWRSGNHFHNPIDNSGFSGIWDTDFLSGMSAIDWAMQPVDTQSCGYYSWNDARDYYYKALTSADKATRETNFAETFRAIGQVMHLVQDMSVPEHTRNNGHYLSHNYEDWVKGQNVSDYSVSVVSFTPSASIPLSIYNLFDTEQYSGMNPDITAQSTIGLAEYSNANFLSPDKIFSGFAYPSYNDTAARIERDPASDKDILYLDKIGHGENINYLARAQEFYNYLPADYKKLSLTLDDARVYSSYAGFLMPRAIGYSSQVLSYFFRGQLDVKMGDGTLKVKNASAETISSGTFAVYYDNADGVRTILTSMQANTLTPGGEQTINFTPLVGATTYMLVYQGQLGDESNAVIGKFIPIPVELVMFTVSLSGITGENLTKKSVLVWNPVSNGLEKPPMDNDDPDFQGWLIEKRDVGYPMFSGFSGDIYEPHKLAPELIDSANIDYHANGGGVFPKTIFSNVLIPNSPIIYSGLRTSKEIQTEQFEDWVLYCFTWSGDGAPAGANRWEWVKKTWMWDDSWPNGVPPWLWEEPHAVYSGGNLVTPGWNCPLYGAQKNMRGNKIMYNFFGHLGIMLAQFTRTVDGWFYNEVHGGETTTLFIPDWGAMTYRNPSWSDEEWYMYQRVWYDDFICGQYTDKIVADVSMVQYTPYTTYSKSYDELYNTPALPTTWTCMNRSIFVQAQALYVPQGTAGFDWIAQGRNTALEAKIIAAINMAYTLNHIPASEIRQTSIEINIVK